jgi:hypothetical protein
MGNHHHIRLSGLSLLLLAAAGTTVLRADAPVTLSQAGSDPSFDTLRYDWLQPVQEQRVASAQGTFSSTSGLDLTDPFAVVSSGSLWQDKQSASYSRSVMDNLNLTCATSGTTQDGTPDSVSHDVTAGAGYKPSDALNLQGNVHSSSADQSLDPVVTSGANASVETHLPLGSVANVAVDSEQSRVDANPGLDVETNAYDAQLQKPVGKLPLTAVLKGHLVETSTPGMGATRIPSLEQSLVWKAGDSTTLQAGLRQQQYQNFPGITNELNQALFADWSQQVLDSVTWHSYAEVMNSRSTVEFAAAGAGANGTPQPTTAGGGTSLGSALPVSTTDEKLTFSTGPSFKLQKDVSASVEYSNTWDQNPAAGSAAQEQRVSVSLKGSF